MESVSRMGEEDRLVLALQPDVEHEPVLVGPRHQGVPAVRVERGQQRVGRQRGLLLGRVARQVGPREQPVEQARANTVTAKYAAVPGVVGPGRSVENP